MVWEHSQKLRLRTARISTFAIVGDEEVRFIDHDTLAKKGLMTFPVRQAKKRARANVVEFKRRSAT